MNFNPKFEHSPRQRTKGSKGIIVAITFYSLKVAFCDNATIRDINLQLIFYSRKITA